MQRAIFAGSVAVLALGALARAQGMQASPKDLVQTMIAREQKARQSCVFYAYLSEERSERTGGHLWKERMVETPWGTVRYLLAVDGRALTAGQKSAEQARLKAATADPASFKKEELKADESEHSQQMLVVLPKAFHFEILNQDAQEIRIGYWPDPSFTPQTIEQRALYGMTGTVVLDAKTLRLHQLEGRALKDVSLGFGPFATLRAGSHFATDREPMEGSVWKTASVKTSIQGRALLLKTIAREQDYRHSEFRRVPGDLGLVAAVMMAEQ